MHATKSPHTDGQTLLKHRQCRLVIRVVHEHRPQPEKAGRNVGMFDPQRRFLDGDRLLQHTLSPIEIPLLAQNHAEVLKARHHAWMVRAQRLPLQVQGLSVQRL